MTVVAVLTELLAVVACDDDQGVVVEVALAKPVEQEAHLVVGIGHRAKVHVPQIFGIGLGELTAVLNKLATA